MRDYFNAGATLVGVGNNIVDAQALARGDRAAVITHAAGFLNI
jgi:2-keto-3-deoxy-6-phosphogluconate aldolase